MKHTLLVSALVILTACQSAAVDSHSDNHAQASQKLPLNQTNNAAVSESDQPQYETTVKHGRFAAKVSSVSDGRGGYNLTITSSSHLDNENILSQSIDAPIVKAEAGDINQDGYPEIVVFTQSVGSGSYGDVIAYSSNSGKSWSEVYFPPLSDSLSVGYMGHDSFEIKNNQLVRAFKLYLEGDTNANPTGKNRQISYRLENGEASRKFVVDKVVEF